MGGEEAEAGACRDGVVRGLSWGWCDLKGFEIFLSHRECGVAELRPPDRR